MDQIELQAVRDAIQDLQTHTVSIERFQRHEDLDEERHKMNQGQHAANAARLVEIEKGQANLMGRLFVLGTVLVLAIPVLTAWLVGAPSHVKP